MEIHIFGYAKIRARWISSPRLAEYSQPISWVFVSVSWNIRNQFRGRMQPIHGTFVAVFLFVRHIIIIYVTRHRKPSATSSQLARNLFISWWLRILKTKTPFLHFKNHTFAQQKPPFCTPKRGFLLCKKGGAAQQKRATRKATTRSNYAKHAYPTPQQHYT